MATAASTILRHDWYQTDSHVVVNFLLRNLKPTSVSVKLEANSITFSTVFEDNSEYNTILRLAHAIDPNQSTWKQYTTKVEIKLRKVDGLRWECLEGSVRDGGIEKLADSVKDVPTYPSSSQHKRDWDKIVTDIEKVEEEEEKTVGGETAVNKLFQKIYAEGSEDVKRAMNKSFMESGGTVLSTNWNDVGEKHVEVKPPEGMEFKKWDE